MNKLNTLPQGASIERQATQVDTEVRRLQELNKEFDEGIARLQDRLSSVLRPKSESANSKPEPREVVVLLAEQLRNSADSFRSNLYEINEMIDRLELPFP